MCTVAAFLLIACLLVFNFYLGLVDCRPPWSSGNPAAAYSFTPDIPSFIVHSSFTTIALSSSPKPNLGFFTSFFSWTFMSYKYYRMFPFTLSRNSSKTHISINQAQPILEQFSCCPPGLILSQFSEFSGMQVRFTSDRFN